MSGLSEVTETKDTVDLMSENLQMICGIDNRTAHELKVLTWHLQWGKWEDVGNFPPTFIPARTNRGAFRSSGRRATASGTQGNVVYQLGDDPNVRITVAWDVPWGAEERNKVDATSSHERVSASVVGFVGRGPVESVTIVVIDGRG